MPNEILRGKILAHKEQTIGSKKIHTYQIESHASRIENNVVSMRPYGLDSVAPTSTDCLLIESDAGVLMVGENHPRPTLTDGQVLLYDANGSAIKLKNTTSGRHIEIGKGGTMKDAARKGDSINASVEFAIWCGQVQTFINAHTPGSITPIFSGTAFAEIATGSTTVGIED